MLGPTLKAARTDAGVSLALMADRVAYAKPYLSQLENGHRTVLPEHVAAYERALGVDLRAYRPVVSVREAAENFAAFRGSEHEQDAGTLMRSAVAHKAVVTGLAEDARGHTRQAAVSLLSGIEQYLGWLHLRLSRWEDSRQSLDRAAVLAIQADDPMRFSTALSFAAFRSSCVGSLGAATDECESARRDPRLHPGMSTYLRFQHAELLAKDGGTRDARAGLADAENAADGLPVRAGSWYSPAFYAAHSALVLHELADTAASQAAERALGMMPQDWTGQPLRMRQAARRLAQVAG